MKKLFTSKYASIALIAFLAIAIFASSSGIAFAQTAGATPTQEPNLFACASSGSLATCLVYFVTYVVSNIVSLFVSLGAWLIQLGLQFDANVYNSPLVQSGFGVCLSIANLGFVLAIIVIAVATILRSETYGYKKALWRLIAMAILVNFGLVITAPIVNFADGMTNYFLTQANGATGVSGFVTSLVNTFNPAAFGDAPAPNAAAMCSSIGNANLWFVPSGAVNTICNGITGQQSNQSPANSFSQALLSLVFTIVFQLTIVLTFLSLAVLLLVRYVYLGVLLVVLPFAWLAWIFPGTSRHFSAWWSNFIKWSFFTPAAMFFVWLALTINKGTYLATVGQTGAVQGSNSPVASIAQVIGQIIPLNQFADDIILMGIMIGGLMMASSLTGKAGSFVVERAKGVSDGITGYVGKQAKKGARATYQKAGMNRFTQSLQTSRIPGVSILGRSIATTVEKGGKDLVSEASKEASAKSSDRLALELQGFLGKEKQFAYLTELQKRADLDKVTTISGKNLGEFIDKNKTAFDQYEQGKLKSDINKSIGSDEEMRAAAEAIAVAAPGTPALAAAIARLDTATEKFNKNMSASDIQKGQIESMFLDPVIAARDGKSFGLSAAAYKSVQDEHVYSMGKHASTQTLSSFHGKLAKGGQQAQFDSAMTAKVATLKTGFGIPLGAALTPAQKTIIMNALFSNTNKKWIESTAAQNMGIDPANWGIV